MTEFVDTLITGTHLFTMQGEGVGYIPDGVVAVRGTRIVAVGPAAKLTARCQADVAEALDRRVVADPQHAEMALMEAMRAGRL